MDVAEGEKKRNKTATALPNHQAPWRLWKHGRHEFNHCQWLLPAVHY
jgi:hypothetical protein